MSLIRVGLLLLSMSACGRVGFDTLCEAGQEACLASEAGTDGGGGGGSEDGGGGGGEDGGGGGPATAPMAPVSPRIVSGTETCGTGEGNTSQTVAIDEGDYIYVVFECGGELTGSVSTDGGLSYSAAKSLGVSGVESLAIEGGRSGEAFIAAATSDRVEILKTVNAGQSWTSNVAAVVDGELYFAISLAVRGDSVYFARELSNIHVFANHNGGEGVFTNVDVGSTASFGEVLVDSQTGDVFLATDYNGGIRVRRSVDGGQNFSAQTNPAGNYFYSDWAIGNGTIFVAGREDSFARIPVSDTGNSSVTGSVLNGAYSRTRAVDAHTDGTLFTIQNDSSTQALSLTRFLPGSDLGETIDLPAGSDASLVSASASVVLYQSLSANGEVAVGVATF